MKKIYTLILIAIFSSSAQSQNNFQRDYQTFLDNQQNRLLTADDDGYILGAVWKRLYGEKEYYLPPITKNVSEYTSRVLLSKFHFLNVEATEISRALLKDMSIIIPEYITDKVNVYLPEIDIAKLSENKVAFTYINYGTQKFQGVNPTPQATIFSEGFESNPFPGSNFWVSNSNTDCGWGNVSCGPAHSGSWNIWCAKTGASCGSQCNDYVNNMTSYVTLKPVSISAYMNVVFTYWRSLCLHGGTADYEERWSSFDGNNTWTLDGKVDGTDANDCVGWVQGTTNAPPGSNYYGVQWLFFSDGSFTGGSPGSGMWLDDLLLAGAVNGIDDIALNNSIQITPNPSNGIFSVQSQIKISKIEILNVVGEKIYESSNQHSSIDLCKQQNGIYFVHIYSEKGTTTKKIIINK